MPRMALMTPARSRRHNRGAQTDKKDLEKQRKMAPPPTPSAHIRVPVPPSRVILFPLRTPAEREGGGHVSRMFFPRSTPASGRAFDIGRKTEALSETRKEKSRERHTENKPKKKRKIKQSHPAEREKEHWNHEEKE